MQVTVRTDGMISACCSIPGWVDIRKNSINDFWNDPGLKKIKDLMLEDEPVDLCTQCYNSEAQSGHSLRLNSLQFHRVPDDLPIDQILSTMGLVSLKSPRYVEMHVNNTCNLKCLTCRPEDSSMFLAENRVLKISEHKQTDYQIPEEIMIQRLQDLMDQDLDFLDLRGGESMLVPQVKKFLQNLPNNHKIKAIRLQTNGTIPLTEEWQEILLKFPKVNMMMSVDAFRDDNHYIRYPAVWETIEENFKIMKTMPNVHAWVSCTLSNLNLLVVHKLVRWCRDQDIQFGWDELVLPPYFHYTNLPSDVYHDALESLRPFPEFDNLQSRVFDTNLWNEFCSIIDVRDRHRRNRIFDVLPELQPYWTITTP